MQLKLKIQYWKTLSQHSLVTIYKALVVYNMGVLGHFVPKKSNKKN